MTTSPAERLPSRWRWLIRLFRWHCGRLVRKQFHAVRLSRQSAKLPLDGSPILIAMNHPGWWDPILCFILSHQFAGYRHYGAMDADSLQKYRFLKRAGVFPVARDNFRGAAEFLRTCHTILRQPKTVLCIMAQGRFADVRQRPLALQPGIGHLAARMNSGWVIPIAIEYVYWNESKPEALVKFGEAIRIGTEWENDNKAWTALIEERLTRTLDDLNAEAISRDALKFTALIAGQVGVGGVYDFWRRTRSLITGQPFDPSHSGVSPS